MKAQLRSVRLTWRMGKTSNDGRESNYADFAEAELKQMIWNILINTFKYLLN